jgi:hypothetical protein
VRIAGVRLNDGRMIWVDALSSEMHPLDRVEVRLSEGDVEGRVFVTPEQIVRMPERIHGAVLARKRQSVGGETSDALPGSEMPPLGSRISSAMIEGMVVRLDPVARTILVRTSESEDVEVQL